MLNKSLTLLAAAGSIALAGTSMNVAAQAPGESNEGYWRSPGAVQAWRNSAGQCWRPSYWTPALANMECDPDLVPKPPAPPPPPPPPKPAPKPEPVPIVPEKPKPAPVKPKPVAQKVTFSSDVFFDFDRAVIKPEGKVALDDLAAKVKDVDLEVVIAVGHTDSIGAEAYNQRLSVRRAESVKAYLVSQGIAPNRVYTEGKGELQPIASNKTREGRAKNRRVEVEVIGTRKQ
jgi:OmpA-OmpF porin, OOP family